MIRKLCTDGAANTPQEAPFYPERVPGGFDLHGQIASVVAHTMHSG